MMPALCRRVGHRGARLFAPVSLLPDTGLRKLYSSQFRELYRLSSFDRASPVRCQGAPWVSEDDNLER
ncbi:jg27415 [Pararge aegeria aegeria]|uniref:Jg27415 protein n=1 Tax=Pararge aegeria aegeria TaxID=348720 RepID=A0A8S4R5I1_9NEOP|nr:jg27415 [Pararge aegeria aegeria]